MTKVQIPVMEVFGPTIQGEGSVIGQKTMFVRTAGCDYSCAWCDSAFTWDGTGKNDIQLMDPEQIWEELQQVSGNGFSHVTISGGNPALIENIQYLITLLKKQDIKIGLETQGSKWQDWFYDIDDLTISPKPPSSGIETNFTVLDQIFYNLKRNNREQNLSIKVVIFNDNDYQYAKNIHSRYSHVPFFLQVGNEDSQTDNNSVLIQNLLQKYESLINKVMEDAELKNVKVLPQLHALVWGNKRGV